MNLHANRDTQFALQLSQISQFAEVVFSEFLFPLGEFPPFFSPGFAPEFFVVPFLLLFRE